MFKIITENVQSTKEQVVSNFEVVLYCIKAFDHGNLSQSILYINCIEFYLNYWISLFRFPGKHNVPC